MQKNSKERAIKLKQVKDLETNICLQITDKKKGDETLIIALQKKKDDIQAKIDEKKAKLSEKVAPIKKINEEYEK